MRDIDIVMLILDERIHWLRELGSDQWSTGSTFRTRLTNNIARGETWLMFDGSDPIATMTMGVDGDQDFWSPEELSERAVYINKMASRIARKGEGIGALMIQWAQDRAARAGLSVVRWDAWRTNPQLQAYYRSIGARSIRTVDVADRWSGALFDLPARLSPELVADVITEQ